MSETKSSWVTAKPEDIKKQIIELAKQGLTADKIGLVLRDQHGIPKAKVLGLKVGRVLKQANLWKDVEAESRGRKMETIAKHAKAHKHDYKAIRSLTRITALDSALSKKR